MAGGESYTAWYILHVEITLNVQDGYGRIHVECNGLARRDDHGGQEARHAAARPRRRVAPQLRGAKVAGRRGRGDWVRAHVRAGALEEARRWGPREEGVGPAGQVGVVRDRLRQHGVDCDGAGRRKDGGVCRSGSSEVSRGYERRSGPRLVGEGRGANETPIENC